MRAHRERIGDLSVEEGRAVGGWLGVLGRAVVGGTRGLLGRRGGKGDGEVEGGMNGEGDGEGVDEDVDVEGDVGDYNIVQNNGPGAAQVVPHVHFHIIPRLAGEGSGGGLPEVRMRSWAVFGRGGREELEEGFAEMLGGAIRRRVGLEMERVRMREGEKGLRGLDGCEGESKL